MRFTVVGGSNEKYIFFRVLLFDNSFVFVQNDILETWITCSIGEKIVTSVWKIHEKA